MGDNDTSSLARSLGRYQAMVVGGLCFIILFAISIMGVMLYLSFSVGAQSARLEAIASQTHNTLCALYNQNTTANREARKLLVDSPAGLVDNRGNVLIDATLIQRGIDQRADTVRAMHSAGLTC